jgi:hypothetical protein
MDCIKWPASSNRVGTFSQRPTSDRCSGQGDRPYPLLTHPTLALFAGLGTQQGKVLSGLSLGGLRFNT